MTAVACMCIEGYPLLVGDLLISGAVAPESLVSLPSTTVQYGLGGGDGPKSMRQKIAIVADNLAVGWAGEHKVAMDVISELKERCEHERFDEKFVAEFLKRQRQSTWEEIQLAGILTKPIPTLVPFRFLHLFQSPSCKICESPTFGKITLLGNGFDLLNDYLRREATIPTGDGPFDNFPFRTQIFETGVAGRKPTMKLVGSDSFPYRVLTYGMVVAGRFLMMEQTTFENLDHKFGSGYEIVSLVEERFTKVTNVLYLFWNANVGEDGKSVTLSPFPYLLHRYEYYDDLLVVRSIALNEKDGTMFEEKLPFLIPPVYRYLWPQEKEKPPKPPLDARWICNFIRVFSHSNSSMRVVTTVGLETSSIKCEEKDGQFVKMTIEPIVYQKILSTIRSGEPEGDSSLRSK